MNEHRFPYEWRLADGFPAQGIPNHGRTVFGTFLCGGGSSMGYKLAGFHHLGGVELDEAVAKDYRANLNPEHLFLMDIRDFNDIPKDELPPELFNLDILDGSPPCSTFSTAGSRENAWGKEKKFREGQKMQRLDDLVFVYCDTIEKLMPRVCILENVSGIIKGNAKNYSKRIVRRMEEIGYRVQVFCLNAATMGVPQMRERVFFIGLRKEYAQLPKLSLAFNEPQVPFRDICDFDDRSCNLTDLYQKYWYDTEQSGSVGKFKSVRKVSLNRPINTINASTQPISPVSPRTLNDGELRKAGTYPMDYQSDKVLYLIGMSVPPVMTAQISYQIYLQWLTKITK